MSLEALSRGPRSRDDELHVRYQQEGFSLSWAAISVGVQGILTAAFLVGLPMVVTALDFEGGNGMLMSIPIWFTGGMLVGLISPGKTFIEPVVAAFLVALPTAYYLVRSETVRTMPVFMYVIMSLIGILFSLVGAYLGERIQAAPQKKAGQATPQEKAS